jgi:hypothetical protein
MSRRCPAAANKSVQLQIPDLLQIARLREIVRETAQLWSQCSSACQRRASNRKSVMVNGIQDPQTHVWMVPGKEDNLDLGAVEAFI